ncbi:MAG: conjugal transfer protein TraF [Nitrospirota bacterium]|jgi:hypothetical protein
MRLVLFLLAGLLAAERLHAEPFQIVGPRALGMGGAHVAVAEETDAAYWNPAAYGMYARRTPVQHRPVAEDIAQRPNRVYRPGVPVATGLGVGAGITGREYEDILPAVDWFLDLSREWRDGGLSLIVETVRDLRGDAREEVRRRVADLNVKGGGVESQANMWAAVRHNNWGIAYRRLFDLTAQAVANDRHLGLEGLTAENIDIALQVLPNWVSQAHPFLARNDEVPRFTRLAAQPLAAHRAFDRVRLEAVRRVTRPLPLGSVVDSVWRTYDAIDAGVAIGAQSNHPDSAFSDNKTFLRWRGADIDEVPLTVGLPLLPRLFVGANLKWMEAETYYQEIEVFNRQDDLTVGEYDVGSTTDNDVGVDLGVLYRRPTWRAGVLARDVNSPSFDYPRLGGIDRGAFVLDPQVRAGVAWLPWRQLLLAADVDLTRNHSTLPHATSRILSGGLEYTPWGWLALRLGVIHDLEQDDTGASAGIGVQWRGLTADVAIAGNFNNTHIHEDLVPDDFLLNDKTVPSDVAVEAALGYVF